MVREDLLEDGSRILDVFQGATKIKNGELQRSGKGKTLSYSNYQRELIFAGLEAVLNYTLHRRKSK